MNMNTTTPQPQPQTQPQPPLNPPADWLAAINAMRLEVAASNAALIELAKAISPKLTREQMCERRKVSRSTLTRQIDTGLVPKPGRDGKWLRSEVMECEALERQRRAA